MAVTPNKYSEKETARRRDAALRRALNTPPQPHKPIGTKAAAKPRRRKAREA
jgi:hypothetical protein